MTTTAAGATARKADLTRDQLVSMHRYVIGIPDGRLAEGRSKQPTTVKDFQTTEADVDAIFETHLPAYLQGREGPVPMVIWAHGGLVGKEAGLGIAHLQLEWWKRNGAFPVQFVWETGLAASLWDAVKDSLPGRARGLDDVFDRMIEGAVRGAGGKATWGAMKTTAKLASEKERGGAWYFAQRLAEYVGASPGAITVHAVGHSAGSIFHSHLVPQLLAAGVDTVSSINLLAPAIRVDEFKRRLMKEGVFDKVERLSLFTMSESFEKDDTCIGIYRKSLLYLIRGALEDEPEAEILGLQESLRRDRALEVLLGAPDSGAKGEAVWSQTVGAGPFSGSRSKTHGGFDNDAATMNSLARRILGREQLESEWGTTGSRGITPEQLWPTEEQAYAYLASRTVSTTTGPGRRALCIGVDAYPDESDRLAGCVADARAWKQELERVGFDVDILEDADATRQRIVERIQRLIVTSREGDILVVQYAGHGTTIEDLDGDDREEAERTGELADEALCPVDFREGELLIDDDLGELWDLLPDGVSLTVFFDSCHSGGNQRAILPTDADGGDRRARLVRMTAENVAAYKAKRGAPAPVGRSIENERSVYFGACQAREKAFESNGQGDFTRQALPLLREAMSSTNQAFYDSVVAAFGTARQQTPVLLPPHLAARTFLAPLAPPRGGAAGAVDAVPDLGPLPPSPAGEVTRRERAVAAILLGVADLIES